MVVQLESLFKEQSEASSKSYRTYNMVIQKGVNGFETVECFHKKSRTLDSRQSSEKASAISTSKILYSKLVLPINMEKRNGVILLNQPHCTKTLIYQNSH